MKTEEQIQSVVEILFAKEQEATRSSHYKTDRARRFYHYRMALLWVLSDEPNFFKGKEE